MEEEHATTDQPSFLQAGFWAALTGIALLILMGVVAVMMARHAPLPLRHLVKLGPIGDFIGGILNPIVALLALAALLKSISIQKQELSETRDALDRQRREQRFFDLLKLYQEAIRTIAFAGLEGKAAFRLLLSPPSDRLPVLSQLPSGSVDTLLEFLQYGFEEREGPFPRGAVPGDVIRHAMNPPTRALTSAAVSNAWNEFSPILDHYFRTIFAMLRDAENLLGSEEHYWYIKLFRAQLSRDELTLLAFNLMFDDEGQKMRRLVAKYGLLKHLPTHKLRELCEHELAATSFGNKWANAKGLALPSKGS